MCVEYKSFAVGVYTLYVPMHKTTSGLANFWRGLPSFGPGLIPQLDGLRTLDGPIVNLNNGELFAPFVHFPCVSTKLTQDSQ